MKSLLLIGLGIIFFTAGFAIPVEGQRVQSKPPAPPGQDPCSHGNTGKPCKPDPQPDNGKDCDHHGNKGGVNEDHCKGTTETTTTGTTETTTTGTTGTTSTTTTTTTPPSTTTNETTTNPPGTTTGGETTTSTEPTTTTETTTGQTGNPPPTKSPNKPPRSKPPVIPGTTLHKCPTGTHRVEGKVGCFREFHGKNHPVFLGNG